VNFILLFLLIFPTKSSANSAVIAFDQISEASIR